MHPVDKIWTEKYRPKKVNELVGDFKYKIGEYLKNPMAIPNFLLYSSAPGTGKTSLSKAIINELGCDFLVINSSDERKLEVIRDKVKQFALTRTSKENLKRCVMLDEADGMTKAAMEALRNTMEAYSSNVFFILTANRLNRIIEPIKSRCILIPFAYPNKDEVYKYLEGICEKEKMDWTDDGLKLLIDKNYPSIRNCVIALQDLKTEGKQVIKENIRFVNELFEELWIKLKEKKWLEIKNTVMSSIADARELNTYFWLKGVEEEPANIKLIQITCRNEKDIAWGADARIIFVSSIPEMIK
jgi:replication factor C small subunit